MDTLLSRIVQQAEQKGLLPKIPNHITFPVPAINKVEMYLSFHGNDSCAHCITSSGPHRKELMHPEVAKTAVKNIAAYSIINSLENLFDGGYIQFHRPKSHLELDTVSSPPTKIDDRLILKYADCIMGKDCSSEWITAGENFLLNFGRPSIRISGGEFYTWPHEIDGKSTTEDERLLFQQDLLETIRKYLPYYDIWILSNGRFAESQEKANKVVAHWAPKKQKTSKRNGQTRIIVSVDPFHKPPKNSTVEQMLSRLWHSASAFLTCSPHIYSVTHKKLFLVGRALNNFSCGMLTTDKYKNVSGSTLFDIDYLKTDPNNLVDKNGCEELKGFLCKTPSGSLLVNNIVISDTGNLAYCCVGVGNYGDFIHSPETSLLRMIKDPISLMLRNAKTAESFLNLAVEMDPSIKVFGNSRYERATGSTCYQVLSGKRVPNQQV